MPFGVEQNRHHWRMAHRRSVRWRAVLRALNEPWWENRTPALVISVCSGFAAVALFGMALVSLRDGWWAFGAASAACAILSIASGQFWGSVFSARLDELLRER